MKIPKPWQPKYFAKLNNEAIIEFCDLAGLPNKGTYWLEDNWNMDFEELAEYMKKLRADLIPAWEKYESRML